MKQAYKFLREGGVERFSGEACREQDLSLWIGPELWAVELVEPVVETPVRLEAAGTRLLERVERWDATAAEAYARAVVERVRALGAPDYAVDAERYCLDQPDPFRAAALGSLIAIHAAEKTGGEAAVALERASQTAFFSEHVLN